MRINKFVLDNNIWVSYLITRKEQRLIDIISDNDLTVFSCNELFEEVRSVLSYPHLEKYHVDIQYAVNIVKKATTLYDLSYPIKRYILTDAADDFIIALALQTNSGFVTSGDSDILSAKSYLEKRYKKLKIITKAEFEKMFK